MIHQNNGQGDKPADLSDANTTPNDPSTQAPDAAAGPETAQVPGAGAQGTQTEGGSAAAPPTPEEQIHILHTQLAEVEKARLLAMADTENMRKRMERELSGMRKFAIGEFAKDIVTLTDTFQRAIQAVPADAVAADPALKSLLDGVTLTERQFINVLEKHGVTRLDPKGEAFNPHKHQAIAQMQNPDVPAGSVMEVVQAGFEIGDRILRPAMVVVAQGGPKAVKPAEPGAGAAAAGAGADNVPPAEPPQPGATPESSPQAGPAGFGRRDTPPGGSG